MTDLENRETSDQGAKDAADLYWLAFLLTGRRDVSIDIASDTALLQNKAKSFFPAWMRAWARRIVIAKALTEIREELAESVRRTELARARRSGAPPRNWSVPPDTTKPRIEGALLAIDVFPRAAVLLSIFEDAQLADSATLLHADISLVRKALAIGLREFTAHLAENQDHAVRSVSPVLARAQAID